VWWEEHKEGKEEEIETTLQPLWEWAPPTPDFKGSSPIVKNTQLRCSVRHWPSNLTSLSLICLSHVVIVRIKWANMAKHLAGDKYKTRSLDKCYSPTQEFLWENNIKFHRSPNSLGIHWALFHMTDTLPR
jgi:hypothetical protein